jgi:hypothetical protein
MRVTTSAKKNWEGEIFLKNPLNTFGVIGVVILDFIDKVPFKGLK